MRAPTGDSLTFSYDGALPTEVRWVGSVNGRVGVTYNNDFRVATQTVNGVNAISLAYDRDGLLIRAGALRLGQSGLSGQLVADTLGPVRSTYQYTTHGELKGYRVVTSGTSLFATGYARDSLGRIVQLFDTTQGVPTRWSFVYDSVGRLAADSVNGVVFHAFTYDINGNRLSYTSPNGTVNYTYDVQDRLLTAGSTSYTYSSNGELKTKSVSGVGTTTYTYDALGSLVTVLLPDGTRIDYLIDGLNRRVGRKVNGVLVQGWLYQDQLTPVAEVDGSGNVVSRFVYGSRANVPDYMVKNGVTYRLIADHLGSVRLVVDTATGAAVQRIDYDEWGNISQNTNPGFQSLEFAGGLYDGLTGLVRFGARDYDAAAGRWTAKDPIRFADAEPSLYIYVGSDPVNLVDRSGRNAGCPDKWDRCEKELLDVGIEVVAHLLELKILKGLEKMVEGGRLARAADKIEDIASTPTTVERLAHHARGFERATDLDEEAVRLTALGGTQYVAGGVLRSRQMVDAFADDMPWWYDWLKVVPGLGLGLEIGEALRECVPLLVQ